MKVNNVVRIVIVVIISLVAIGIGCSQTGRNNTPETRWGQPSNVIEIEKVAVQPMPTTSPEESGEVVGAPEVNAPVEMPTPDATEAEHGDDVTIVPESIAPPESVDGSDDAINTPEIDAQPEMPDFVEMGGESDDIMDVPETIMPEEPAEDNGDAGDGPETGSPENDPPPQIGDLTKPTWTPDPAVEDPRTHAEIEVEFPPAITTAHSEQVRVDIAVPAIFRSTELVIVDKVGANNSDLIVTDGKATYDAFIEVSPQVYVVAVSSDFDLRPTFPYANVRNGQTQTLDLAPNGESTTWVWSITAPDQPKDGILTISVHDATTHETLWNRNIEIVVEAPALSLLDQVRNHASTITILLTVTSGSMTGFFTYLWPTLQKRIANWKARPITTAQCEAFLAQVKQTDDLAQLNDWLRVATDATIRTALENQIRCLGDKQRIVHHQLPNALLKAFDTKGFERMLQAYFDTRLEEITNSEDGLRDIVMDVVAYAESRAQLPALVSAARLANPDNRQLAEVEGVITRYFEPSAC